MRTAALIAVGLLIAAAVAWFAAEQHYDNCVNAAKLRHPVGLAGGNPRQEYERWKGVDVRRRSAAIDGCSRLPW
jgi:hypothetical protein